MEYPIDILPNPHFKLIDCDLSDHFLIRHFDVAPGEAITDPETSTVLIKYICAQRDHIDDLSTSLLGIFKIDNIHIAFTAEGAVKFRDYCQPDEVVDIPEFEIDFFMKENRSFWCAPISKLHKKEFIYNVGEDELVASCLVTHTPAKWNYWHFSLKWKTDAGPLEDLNKKQRKNLSKRIGQSAIVAIREFATTEIPNFVNLSKECYIRN